MAWLPDPAWNELQKIFNMWRQEKVKNQPVTKSKNKGSAFSKTTKYTKATALATTPFYGLPALPVETQVKCLKLVSEGGKSLADLKGNFFICFLLCEFESQLCVLTDSILMEKNLAITRQVFVALAGCKDWDECASVCDPRSLEDSSLRLYAESVSGAFSKQKKAREKTGRRRNESYDSAQAAPLPSVDGTWVPNQFRTYVHQARNWKPVEMILTRAWKEMSITDVKNLFGQMQTFNAAPLNFELQDKTKVHTVNYKVIKADSCDRSWVRKKDVMKGVDGLLAKFEQELKEHYVPSKYCTLPLFKLTEEDALRKLDRNECKVIESLLPPSEDLLAMCVEEREGKSLFLL